MEWRNTAFWTAGVHNVVCCQFVYIYLVRAFSLASANRRMLAMQPAAASCRMSSLEPTFSINGCKCRNKILYYIWKYSLNTASLLYDGMNIKHVRTWSYVGYVTQSVIDVCTRSYLDDASLVHGNTVVGVFGQLMQGFRCRAVNISVLGLQIPKPSTAQYRLFDQRKCILSSTRDYDDTTAMAIFNNKWNLQ